MKTLREFRRFILTKCAEDRAGDIRSHVINNLAIMAMAFRVPAEVLLQATEAVQDDLLLATRFLEIIAHMEIIVRKREEEDRARAAQQAADILAASAKWEGQRARLDMAVLLASVLTRRSDEVRFVCDAFDVAVPIGLLVDVARVPTIRRSALGWIDRWGLHLRWPGGTLHLRPHHRERARQVLVRLRQPSTAAA